MNYKEKYEQVLERAREQYNKRTPLYDIEYIFPELKENEDEKIRKAIISCCLDHGSKYNYLGVSMEDMCAWLAKQGENKKLDADKVIEWLKNTIKEMAENYGVYKATRLILPYDSIEDLINDFKENFRL